MKRIDTRIAAPLAVAFALVACNDGAFVPKEGNAITTAEGVYIGTLANSPSGATDFAAIVLADGSYWTLYGQAAPTLFSVAGFARGSGASSHGEFTSDDGTDFGFTPPEATTLEAQYDAEDDTIEGSSTTIAGTTTFTGGPITNSSYEYGATPDLLLLAGTWDLLGTDGVTYTLDIDPDGTFDFNEQGGGGCTGSGTFTTHSSGKNLFNISVVFDNTVECAHPDTTASGIALAYPITGADATQLVAAAVDDLESFGLALSGTLPDP